VSQLHDFSPGIGSNGLFWILQVPDEAIKITEDTLTISLTNASVVDQFRFPGGAGNNLGTAGVPATLSFEIIYKKTGAPRHVHPTSADPLSPFNWGGEMWMATNSGTFSLTYTDGTFSAQGSFDSAGNFGEMGTERNGTFVSEELEEISSKPGSAVQPKPALIAAASTAAPAQANATRATNSPKFKGRVPVESLVH
jgi:hypothetical protein